jgi:hypothetical protein
MIADRVSRVVTWKGGPDEARKRKPEGKRIIMWTPLRGALLAIGVGIGLASMLSTTSGQAQAGGVDVPSTSQAALAAPTSSPSEDDPRVRAFVRAYGGLIDSVFVQEDDVVFAIGGQSIHFAEGRMLAADGLDRADECDPIFYRYPLEPLTEPLPEPGELPAYCSDLLEILWGATEKDIREHGRSVRFLDHRMFVNELLVGPLAAVEADIRRAAPTDTSVSAWLEELDITYSFDYREIAGSANRSQHSWGMAVDFVPGSYHGRAVYWRWSRALDREGWHRTPIEERWSPPRRVVETFERHGFVWGGKWAYFDAIHFEYRPEILLYSRLAEQE